MLIIYAIVSFILLIIVVPCILICLHRRSISREQELNKAIYMMEIQKLLFGAHTDTSYLIKALKKCSKMLQAEQAFILTLEDNKSSNLYCYPSTDKLHHDYFSTQIFSVKFPIIHKMIAKCQSIVINNIESASEDLQKEISLMSDSHLRNIMFVPIMNNENSLQAVIGATNFNKAYENAEFLECVTSSFLMAILNYNSYQRIEEMAIIDMLTGLKNRNCYQHDIRKLANQGHQSLCCIYMDVNGLHEMNNHLGHAVGDEMLHAIGVSIQKHFGDEYSYRLGGDEFITFCKDISQEEVQIKLNDFIHDMDSRNYHISVGSFWQDTTLQIDAMVSNAEKIMYENKRRYYQKKGDVSKAREMNRKLEETLLQKKDFEYFLTLIAHYFLGVYVVDLNTDNTRAIYKPSYFDEILKENNNKYRISLEKYCQKFVLEDEQSKILKILNYDNIMEDLLDKKVVVIKYMKTDNTSIRLRVFPSAEFSEECRETFWLFEEVSARFQ